MEKEIPSMTMDISKVTYEEIPVSYGDQQPYIRFTMHLGNHKVNWHILKKDFLKVADEIKSAISVSSDTRCHYDPSDYMVLNPINELRDLAPNEIAVGVKNFRLGGQECMKEFEYEGKKYKRKRTGVIPKNLAAMVCSVQIYEEVNKSGI